MTVWRVVIRLFQSVKKPIDKPLFTSSPVNNDQVNCIETVVSEQIIEADDLIELIPEI